MSDQCVWCDKELVPMNILHSLRRPSYRALARHLLSGCMVCGDAAQRRIPWRMCTEGQRLAEAACDEALHQVPI